MSEISQELVERMVAHFRHVAEKYAHVKDGSGNFNDELKVVRAIVAELPAPVDPDLIEARKIIAEHYRCLQSSAPHLAAQVLSGDGDDWFQTKCTIAAIRRGRELASTSGGVA